MIYYTVSERWHEDHSTEFRIGLHIKLDEMRDQGKFIWNTINNDRSVYDIKGSPTKIFTSIEAVNEYIEWIKLEYSYFNPTINSFESEDELYTFLRSIHNPNHVQGIGTSYTEKEKEEYKIKHNIV